ncbi:MAG: hypothetical protein IKI84_10285 [Clostridia bacterium]|nr:hypothetical protein [Clostridia bacterium]
MERYEDKQKRLEQLYDEVLAIDAGALTEEEARQAGIRFLSAYVETARSDARASLGCNIIMVIVCTLIFRDAAISPDDEYDSYCSAGRLLKKFEKNTYGKGYVTYLTDCQERIREQRQRRARMERLEEERRRRKEARRAAGNGKQGG